MTFPSMDEVFLRQLSLSDGADCYEMLQHIGIKENDFTNPVKDYDYLAFKGWLKIQDNWSKGINLPYGYVPQVCYWLIVNNQPVGLGKIRLGLTEQSQLEGGNIGYAIDSRFRGNGYGSVFLKLLLIKAKEKGLSNPLFTIKKSNIASKCVVEKNGGLLIKETKDWLYYEIRL